jgi:hypothetical protein
MATARIAVSSQPPRALSFDSLYPLARIRGNFLAGRGEFLNGLFYRFTGFARSLLNPTEQFFVLALAELEVVIRELGPLLFQLALGNVPIAFDFEFVHNSSSCSSFPFCAPSELHSGLSPAEVAGEKQNQKDKQNESKPTSTYHWSA